MTYTKRHFGAELILHLENGYDIKKTSEWADKVYYEHLREIDSALSEIIQNIASMSFGKQFEYSEKELRDLAITLIKSDN